MLALTENATAVGARPGAAGVADRGSLRALARFGRREPLPESGRITQVCSADVAQAVIGLFTRAIARERPALQPATCVQMVSVSRPARGALRGVAAGAERLVLLLHLRARNAIAARAACALRLDLPRPLLLAHCERAALALVTRLAHIGAHVTLENVPVVSLRAVARLVVDCLERGTFCHVYFPPGTHDIYTAHGWSAISTPVHSQQPLRQGWGLRVG